MSGKKPKIPVDDYYLSIHYGFCLRADELVAFRIDEKEVPGIANLTANATVQVNEPNFFGGDQKRGGIMGVAHVLLGDESQVLPEEAAARMTFRGSPLTSATAPGYRGVTSIFLHGVLSAVESVPVVIPGLVSSILASRSGRKGWRWGSNSPMIPKVDGRFRRVPKGLDPTYAVYETSDGYQHVNPSHMIYECMTSIDYGSAIPSSQIDVDSFLYAAEILFNEKLYLSTAWTREDTVENFVADILAHIDGVIYIDLDTGLYVLKLFRDDYDLETIPTWGPDKVRSKEFTRKGRGEIVTRISLVYTNPETGKDETITSIDEASSAMQDGAIVPSTVNKRMIRNPDIAAQQADKELRVAAAPLAAGRLDVLRDANGDGTSIKAGQVFRLSYPDLLGEETIICRIVDVNYGKTNERYISVSWTEDIFSLPVTRSRTGQSSLWVNPSINPVPLAQQSLFSIPYPLTFLVSEAGVPNDSYPDVYIGLLGNHPASDVSGFQIVTTETDTLGGSELKSLGIGTLSETATLAGPVIQQSLTSNMPVVGSFSRVIVPGEFVLIGDPSDETTCEWGLITADPDYETTPGVVLLSVKRGIYDTVPREWPSGTRVWFFGEDFDAFDPGVRPGFAATEYSLLTVTSRGTLAYDDATPISITPGDRPYAPFRVANFKVDGTAFGTKTYATDPLTVPITWANRDRSSEDSVPLAWDDASVPLEAGVTITAEIYDVASDTVIHSVTGLTGTSHTFDITDFGSGVLFIVRAVPVRDGIRAVQNNEITVYLAERSGYGSAYGVSYGA
jgi:hypothetical protein